MTTFTALRWRFDKSIEKVEVKARAQFGTWYVHVPLEDCYGHKPWAISHISGTRVPFLPNTLKKAVKFAKQLQSVYDKPEYPGLDDAVAIGTVCRDYWAEED